MTAPVYTRTCYRHPDRVAGIACQRCGRPICPSCMHQASVGFHCPECVHERAQVVARAATRERPLATMVLIAANVAVFVLGLATEAGAGLTGRPGGVVEDGLLFGPYVPDEPWRLVTSGFLHAGLLHIGLNMWALWILGSILEPALGRVRFLVLYGASLTAGALGVVLLSPEEATVGASGAIYGVLGAMIVVAKARNLDLMRTGLLPTLGINLLLTVAIPGISIGGHLGGLVGGLAVGALVVLLPRRWGRTGEVASVALGTAAMVGFGLVAYLLMVGRYG